MKLRKGVIFELHIEVHILQLRGVLYSMILSLLLAHIDSF